MKNGCVQENNCGFYIWLKGFAKFITTRSSQKYVHNLITINTFYKFGSFAKVTSIRTTVFVKSKVQSFTTWKMSTLLTILYEKYSTIKRECEYMCMSLFLPQDCAIHYVFVIILHVESILIGKSFLYHSITFIFDYTWTKFPVCLIYLMHIN